jgi:hypothetical protein
LFPRECQKPEKHHTKYRADGGIRENIRHLFTYPFVKALENQKPWKNGSQELNRTAVPFPGRAQGLQPRSMPEARGNRAACRRSRFIVAVVSPFAL